MLTTTMMMAVTMTMMAIASGVGSARELPNDPVGWLEGTGPLTD